MKFQTTKNFDLINAVIHSIGKQALRDDSPFDSSNLRHSLFVKAATDNGDLIGFFRLDEESYFCVQVHLYICKKYQGTKILAETAKEFEQWVSKHFRYTSAICKLPSVCRHVIIFAKRNGFKKITELKNAEMWQGKLCNSEIFFKKIKGG